MTPRLTHSKHELVLGRLPLSGGGALTRPGQYAIEVMADGFQPGSHEAVLAAVDLLGAAGSSVRWVRAGNAMTTLRVRIRGYDHRSVSRGEQDLMAELPRGRGEEVVPLVHRPADGRSPAGVRDLVFGELKEFDFDGDAELRFARYFRLELTHLPFVHSEFETVVPALPAGAGAPVTIDTCSTTSGWSAIDVDGAAVTPTVDAGTLRFTHAAGTHPDAEAQWDITRTGAVDFAGTPYLVIEARVPSQSNTPVVLVDGGQVRPMRSVDLADGWRRHTFDMAGRGILPSITTRWAQATGISSGEMRLRLVERRGVSSDTPRQSLRTIHIDGTEAASGSAYIGRPAGGGTDPLGITVLHLAPRFPGGLDPDITKWRLFDAGTVDATAPAGRTFPVGPTPVAFNAPAATFPNGRYAVAAILRAPTAQSLEVQLQVAGYKPGSEDLLAARQHYTQVTLEEGKDAFVILAHTSLPALRSTAGKSTFVVKKASGADTGVSMRALWAFRTCPQSSLTVIDCPEPHLRIDAPKQGPNTDIWASATPDFTQGYFPPGASIFPGRPLLVPGEVDAYVATALADNAVATWRYHANWDWHPASDGRTPA